MSVVLLWLLIVIDMWYLLPIEKNSKKRSALLPKPIIIILLFLMMVYTETGKWNFYNSLTSSRTLIEMTRDDWFENCEKNDENGT